MSPSDLEVLLHYHRTSMPHPRWDAPAVIGAIDGFLKDGIIVENQENRIKTYTITDKGKAWLTMILKTPMPLTAWVDENNKVVFGGVKT